jgi:hypothetical protein
MPQQWTLITRLARQGARSQNRAIMKNKAEVPKQQRVIEDIKAKQRNFVFPDTLRNSRRVDEFLWKGSPNAPLVQRAAAWMFGLFFVLAGVAFLDVAFEKHYWIFGVLSLGWFLVGGKVFLNGFRRRNAKAPKGK